MTWTKAIVLLELTLFEAGRALGVAAVDPRGPVDYPGLLPVVDGQGVQARDYVFRDACRKPAPWQARWIWLGQESPSPVAMFRKQVTLAEAPQRVAAWLTADVKYPALHQWPVGLARTCQHGPRLRGWRHPPLVL